MNLSNLHRLDKKVDWVKTVYRNQSVFFRYLVFKGGAKKYHKNFYGLDFGFRNRKYVGHQVYIKESEVDELIKMLEKRFDKDKDYFDFLAKKIEGICKSLISFSTKVKKKKYNTSDQVLLLHDFNQYIDYSLKQIPSFQIVLSIGAILENRIRKLLPKDINLDNYFEDLILNNVKESNNTKEREGILNIVDFIRSYKINNWEKDPRVIKIMRKHIKNFGWMNTSYFLGNPWTLQELAERIKGILLAKDKGEDTALDDKRNKFTKTPRLSYKVIHLINLVKKYLYLRMFRVDAIHIADCNTRNLQTAISKSLGINRDDLIFMTFDEIISALKGSKVDKNELRRKRKSHAIFLLQSKVYIISGDDVYFFIDKDSKVKESEIKGMTATKGLVRGVARILKSAEDNYKIKTKDILVTKMTTPDYLPAMEKAAAFVTDEGGVICHAAIMAREMNKPCIVGTKIATQFLKDGDLVEVDANKGIVKKLNK